MSYIIIMFFCVADYLFTVYHMSNGAQEANPLMQGIMCQPLWVSFIIKNAWTAFLLVVIFLLESKCSFQLIWWAKKTMVTFYGLVIGYHLILFFIYH